MKISLFFKPFITKVCYSFVILSIVAGTPSVADASFFSNIFGSGQAQADESNTESTINQNSQNLPLLESLVNPDVKNVDDGENSVIVQDDLFIYNEGSFLPDVPFEKSSISDQINVYTVEEGDTLSGIADLFNISVNTIRWENNITGQKISVGQKLNILPVTGVKHIVKSGDTINKIADKYDAESEDILIFNDITDKDLKKGDIIFVPNGIIKPVVVKTQPSSKPSTSVSNKSSNTKAPSGYYLRPVVGIVTSPYGSRRRGFHLGVDFGNVRGTPIVAAASGVVSKVITGCTEGKRSCGGGYGNYIDIEHPNGTMTRYAHLSKVSVNIGESVSQGEKIGALGNTGISTGPHLHFEIENTNGSKMRPPF
jgi:murein DD-endopeptidase MepM/ murein hydrolase activator NlpD